MPKVKFIKEKVEVEVEQGANLRDVARENGIEIHHHGIGNQFDASAKYLNCSILSDLAKSCCGKDTAWAPLVGGGMCGTCHVYIKNGMENCSQKTVKEKIRKIVESEDSAKPLSDSAIVQTLKAEGLQIARRTVAKYREELKIPSSSQRRRAFG